MSWSRNPQPIHPCTKDTGRLPGESSDTQVGKASEIERLQWRVDAERRSAEILAVKLREMTTAYHELLDREGEAIEGIAYAMLEKPKDMGLLEYVSDLDAYTRKLRLQNEELKIERDRHLSTLLRRSVA